MSRDDPSQLESRARGASPAPAGIAVAVACAGWRADLTDARALCREAVQAALEGAGLGPLAASVEIGVRLADDAAVRRLNARFRGRDAATNVLSFPLRDGSPGDLAAAPADGPPLALGDVVLAYETVRAEADAQGKALADHLRHLTVHGVLHLAGYDHDNDADAAVMERLETAVLADLGVTDPYAPTAAPPPGVRQPHGQA